MTSIQKEQIQNTIPRYCSIKNISANELAIKVGVSAATISNMKTGKWDNIDSKLWKRVWQLINPESMEGIFQTADCKSVFDLCNNAIQHKRMIGLTGDTGMGKSTALKAYSVRPNVFYFYIDGTVTPNVFLSGLLLEMGIWFNGSPNEMRNQVVGQLSVLDEPLLIIDECGKLKDKMILLLHSIRDMTMQNAGIVLAGMPAFKNAMIDKVNRGVTGYSEFFRRVNMWHELSGLNTQEIAFVLESKGITDKEAQREFKKLTRFGDLMNAISLHKTLNN